MAVGGLDLPNFPESIQKIENKFISNVFFAYKTEKLC